MSISNNHLILILFLILVIFYIFFQNILNKVEQKLNNLNINVQQPKVEVEFPEHFKNPPTKEQVKTYIIESQKYNNINGETEKIDPEIDKDFSSDPDFLFEGFDKHGLKNKDWSVANNQKSSHLCFENHIHEKCDLGIMNYADPNDLNKMDYNIFKLNYPPNMTMQDYVNWLYCYEGEEYKLPYNHLKNLEKLKKNIQLEEKKGICPPPGYEYAPLSSEKYFDEMYNINDEFNIASKLNSQTGPLMGYNADEYSEFSQNLDVKGTSSYIRNCDIALKKTAKKVRDFVQPKDSNNIEMNKEYEKYYVKDVEI